MNHLFLLPLLVAAAGLVACSGGVADLGGAPSSAQDDGGGTGGGRGGGGAGSGDGRNDAAKGEEYPNLPDSSACTLIDYEWLVVSGGTLPSHATGSVRRLSVVYQGARIVVTEDSALNMTISSSVGPFQAGSISGSWAELRDAAENVQYTESLQDPTHREVPGPSPDGASGRCPSGLHREILQRRPAQHALRKVDRHLR